MKLWLLPEGYAVDGERRLYVADLEAPGGPRWYFNGAHVPPEELPEGWLATDDQATVFASEAEFQGADERRLRSPERDYGVMWRAGATGAWVQHRVSYIFLTGELYAVKLTGSWRGEVELLATFPYEECGCLSFDEREPYEPCRHCLTTGRSDRAVEAAMSGWEHLCGGPTSLDDLRAQLA